MRFNELLSSIDGISLKVLTSTLRVLEQDTFISRTIYPEVPPRVEYKLTQVGMGILPYIKDISEWAAKNINLKT